MTIDAMGTQTKIAEQIIDDDGDSVLALKGNQPTLYAAVQKIFEAALADPSSPLQPHFYETVEKGHGRVEIRRHWMIDDDGVIAHLNPK